MKASAESPRSGTGGRSIGRASAPAHQLQLAEQNAALAINVGGDLQQPASTLRGWFEEAQ